MFSFLFFGRRNQTFFFLGVWEGVRTSQLDSTCGLRQSLVVQQCRSLCCVGLRFGGVSGAQISNSKEVGGAEMAPSPFQQSLRVSTWRTLRGPAFAALCLRRLCRVRPRVSALPPAGAVFWCGLGPIDVSCVVVALSPLSSAFSMCCDTFPRFQL